MTKKDKRVKGCPNENCSLFKKEKYTIEDQHCKSCGEELVIVCAKCFGPIEDIDANHTICEGCRLKAEQTKERIFDVAKKVGKGASAAAGLALTFFVGYKNLK